MNKTLAIIEKGEDGTFSVYTPNLSSVIYGEGASVEEAKADFINSYKEIVKFTKEDNIELPNDLVNLVFEFRTADKR